MLSEERRQQWADALHIYSRKPVLLMLLLGFSSGLPYLLVFSTLTARLSDVGIDVATIGFFSWLGITYSIKVLWAPVVDQLRLPLLGRLLGQRRSWMLLAQLGVAVGLWQMAIIDPHSSLMAVAWAGLLVAFSSATQDVSIDAYRIEAAAPRFQGAMSATYVFGYRLALLVAGAGALYIAQFVSWRWAYLAMALLMGVGVLAVLIASDPQRHSNKGTHQPVRREGDWLSRAIQRTKLAVIDPFRDFIQRFGRYAVPILLLVAIFRICDISMGVMANPFYLDYMGFSKVEVANVTKIFGFMMTIIGSALGGILVMRYNVKHMLLAGAILSASTNLLFVLVAQFPPNIPLLAVTISADNLSGGLATVAFIAWLSSMTSTTFTATQYALFSSLMTLPGKFIGGFSGVIVALGGYPMFFLVSALLGLPAIFLAWKVLSWGPELDEIAKPADTADDTR